MLLSDYITQVRDLLHDPNANFYSDTSLTRWINQGRREAAKNGQCVRVLTPGTSSVLSIAVTAGGSGYTAATVAISAPDATGNGSYVNATATATVLAGAVTSITVVLSGSGYVAAPTVTISGNGTGATATATLTPHLTTIAGQEVYTMAAAATIIDGLYAGLGDILGVQSVSVSWGAMKPSLGYMPWSSMQAYLRAQAIGFQNYPAYWSQYGQGTTGSIYVWPIPAQVSAMEWDCYCTVKDLASDASPDLIPEPWTQAAIYYAGYKAYWNAQRFDDARTAKSESDRFMLEARAATTPTRTPDNYSG